MRLSYPPTVTRPRSLRLSFVTSNIAKLLQARIVLSRVGVQIEVLRTVREPYEEDYSLPRDEMLRASIRDVMSRHPIRSTFFIEDTSLRINALSVGDEDFPGVRVKDWFAETSFEALDAELQARGTDRSVRVRSDIALYLPLLDKVLFFDGVTSGEVASSAPSFQPNPQYPWLTPQTFNGWFIPAGANKPLGAMSFEESVDHDFRVKSLLKLADWVAEMNLALNMPSNLVRTRREGRSSLGQPRLFHDIADNPNVLVVVGDRCAGKSTFADIATRLVSVDEPNSLGPSDLRVNVIEASAVMRLAAEAKNKKVRNSAEAKRFLQQNGMALVAKQCLEMIDRSRGVLNIITGLRTVEELVELVRADPDVALIHITADDRLRFERQLLRPRDGKRLTFEEFLGEDEDQRSFGLLRLANVCADISIPNDGSIEAYADKVRATLLQAATSQGLTSIRIDAHKARLESETLRALSALSALGRAATCEEIAARTAAIDGKQIRIYNVNRALKRVPELATRIEQKTDKLRYTITETGRSFVDLMREYSDRLR
jgi:inosine/xanthosine triphosphate pyrophosphatase family protein/dephospho-CoA kinase